MFGAVAAAVSLRDLGGAALANDGGGGGREDVFGIGRGLPAVTSALGRAGGTGAVELLPIFGDGRAAGVSFRVGFRAILTGDFFIGFRFAIARLFRNSFGDTSFTAGKLFTILLSLVGGLEDKSLLIGIRLGGVSNRSRILRTKREVWPEIGSAPPPAMTLISTSTSFVLSHGLSCAEDGLVTNCPKIIATIQTHAIKNVRLVKYAA